MIYGLILLAAIIAGMALFGPPIFIGGTGDSNAYQNLLWIRVYDGGKPAAELAQELFEWRYRWCRPWMWFCDLGKREMELTSHECETQAAALLYGAEEAAYRRGEANEMPVYDWLKDLTPDQIEAEMLKRRPKALLWVGKNRRKLEGYK